MAPSPETDQDIGTERRLSDIGAAKKPIDRRVLACGTCRRRKLKCEGGRPKCATCQRLGHPCEYDEVRKKSGPKRGYVKELEARLKQVETLLTSQIDSTQSQAQQGPQTQLRDFNAVPMAQMTMVSESVAQMPAEVNVVDPSLDMVGDFPMAGIEEFNWDMISLGLEEPLPPPEVMDELYETYFDKIHPSLPMLHKPRFMASLNLSINQRPPVCLRYIMWAHACQLIPRYKTSAEQFYIKSRKYLEQDEMRGHGEGFVTLAHAQTWSLIGTFEFKNMYFPRAWMSCGRATRLSLLLGLYRQDRGSVEVKQTIAPPRDWTEKEERRRTFWMAYCQDRYASIGTGWPMSVDERDILTNLPASDEAYLTGREECTPTLAEVLEGKGCDNLSSFAGVCLLSTLFGRNLTHLHRPSDEDSDHDLNGAFWKRHRQIDNVLLNTSLALPARLRLPYGVNDPNTVFTNMSIHTSTICLHQAAIFKADKHRLPAQISAESKRRCIVAAEQITSIMKMVCHQDLGALNPFIAFCLYVAARVFVQYLKSKRDDATVLASLSFLLAAMAAFRDKNPLTESFLVQLEVDLEGSGLQVSLPLSKQGQSLHPFQESCPATQKDGVQCIPMVHIRQTKSDPHQPAEAGDGNFNMKTGADFITPPGVDNVREFDGGNTMKQYANMQTDRLHESRPFDSAFGKAVNMSGSPQDSSSSNQPTPSVSSNHNSSHSSFSPPADSNTHYSVVTGFVSRKSDGPNGSNMPAATGFSPMGPAGYSYMNNKSGFTRSDSGEHPTGQNNRNERNDTDGMNFTAHPDNTDDSYGIMFGSTSFTPGPLSSGTGFTPGLSGGSGLTPGPSGFTPAPSGLTPGSSGMAWSEININDNDQWMYTSWQEESAHSSGQL